MKTEALALTSGSLAGIKRRESSTILYLLPTLIIMFGIGIVPLMTVVNYSLYVLFSGSIPHFIGLENYYQALRDPVFIGTIGRQFMFTFCILIIEIPLGVALALTLPEKGVWVGLILVLLGIPLLIPWNVVGIIWRIFTRPDIGVVTKVLEKIGMVYNVAKYPGNAWWTVVVMDVWHWTPLVILLTFAGLRAIPPEFYQAARVDSASRWATFRIITLPKLKNVLIIALLLRVMDSFRIYDEPFILTAGGPGSTTLFLSHYTSRQVIGSFDMGFGSAISVIYNIIVIVLCYLLYTTMMKVGGESK
jgi:glycerol transport system permease protein